MRGAADRGGGPPGSNVIFLDVGSVKYKTTLNTLLAVQGSFFWNMLNGSDHGNTPQRLPSGEWFIDRNGDVFKYVLEYLRSCASAEPTFPLPNEAK
jgi:hypothetical protein